MSLTLWIALGVAALVVAGVLAVVLVVSWRTASASDRLLVKRVMKLPFRRKLTLASRLARDHRIPVFCG